MCGRFTLASDIDEFLRQYDIEVPEPLKKPRRYNLSPSQPVVGLVADPHLRLEIMEWGYLPAWAKPGAGMHTVINARIESIAEKKPYFRGAFHSARCAILADGFYEWKKVRGGKQPYRITLKDGGVFAFAGLWSHVNTGDGSERATCAIITVEPNELMADIHNRMPAILTPTDLSVWLDPKARERDLYAAVEPYPTDLLRAYPVSTVMNSAAHDAPDCIAPVTGDEA